MKRLKVGVFSFACCEGCCISIIESLNSKLFDWKDKVEFVNFRALKKVGKIRDMDVAFIEGAVGSKDDILRVGEIRAYSKKVVALGSGAINGWPSNLRNEFKGARRVEVMKVVKKLGQLEKVVPINEVIKVDAEIAGCPVNEVDFVAMVEKLIMEKNAGRKAVKKAVKKKVKKKIKKVVKKNG